MDYRILGPLEVSQDGAPVSLGGDKQRALLAALLLRRGAVVSRDRLVDDVWGAHPPATADKSVQVYVSRLRKTLGAGVLETHGHGYRLALAPDQVDADRFEALLGNGRRRHLDGDPEGAAALLRDALSLWRGPALADFAYEPFAQGEAARLEELHLAAVEERIEADLALGAHAELVPELDALVREHPLRERLRGQLMLALYRSDRQADALSVYQRGRRALADDLGLEPSEGLRRLERQILEQDPALASPARAWPRLVPAPARRHPRLLVLFGALGLAAVIAGAVVQLIGDGSGPTAAAVEGPGAGVLDPKTGALLASVPLGSAPSSIAAGEGSVWVLDADDKTISRIDPTDRTHVRTFSIASTPTDLAVGAGAIWVGNAFPKSEFSSFPESVSRVDPESGIVDATIALPRAGAGGYFQGGGLSQRHIAVTDAAVWVINPNQTVSRIDPHTNRRVATVKGVQASDIAAGEGEVWVVGSEGLVEIDPRTNAVSRRIDVAAESLTALAVGAGAVWVADPFGGSVWRIDPGPEPLLRQIPLEFGVRSITFGHGAL